MMYVRTEDEVKTVIKHAKLEEEDLAPVSQVLFFSSHNSSNDSYKFIELNSLLLNVLHEGQNLKFKGDGDENAVLCTSDKTYEVKEAETSNSMLLIPSLEFKENFGGYNEEFRTLKQKEIVGVFYKYLELKPCKPRLRKLKKLLEDTQYRGPEYENSETDVCLYSFKDLLNVVQASEEELKIALSELAVYNIGGKCRLLEHDYHFQVLSAITNLIDENSLSVCKLNKEEIMKSVTDQIPLNILEQCFDWFTERTDSTAADGSSLYKLSEDKVCRFFAEVVLRPAGKFNLKDFITSWQDCVPEGLKTDMKQLKGFALVDRSSKPEVIWYFSESDLPEDINERFFVLFQTREKWTFDEIEPYIVRLASDRMNVNALLTKYTRASNVGGVRYYTAKHRH